MKGKVKCTCGWSWNKSDSSKKDMYICHQCGRDNSNNMKNGGEIPIAQKGAKKFKVKDETLEGQVTKDNLEDRNVFSKNQLSFKKPVVQKQIKRTQKEAANPKVVIFAESPEIKKYKWNEVKDADEFYDPNLNPTIGRDSTFIKEAQNVKDFYERTDPNVKVNIVPLYGDKKVMQEKLKRMTPFDKFAIFGHFGDRLAGIPNSEIAKYLSDSRVNDCYFGSCGFENEINKSALKNLSGKTLNYRPSGNYWWGFDPNAKTFDEGMWSRTGEQADAVKIIPIKEGVTHKIKKSKNGGWLDNYNDSQASAPEGMVGDGYSNVGRNYSPAWGGQFQMGGNVYPVNYVPQAQEGKKTYSYPLRDKLYPGEDEYFKANPHVRGMAAEDNKVIINPYSGLTDQQKQGIIINESARLAMRNGYERPTFDLTPEQKEAFKDYSTDEQDQRETIIGRILSGDPSAKNVTPEQKKYAEELQKVLKFQMGGSLPGATGSMYARIGAPSKGPRRNQVDVTDASAQNGQEMKFYQEGLDWKPKTISRNGGWLDGYEKAQDGTKINGDKLLEILKNIDSRKTPEPVGPYRTNVNLDPNSSEYANAYKDNNVFRYDKNSDTYIGRELPELVLQGKPKEKGFWSKYVDNVVREHQGDGPLGAIIGTPLDAVFGLPSKALMYGLTDKVQRPSQAMKLNNPVESLIVDIGADPLTYVGGQIFTGKNPITGLRNLKNINPEGKIFSGMNDQLNNMAIQNTERYMAKRTPTTSTLSPEMEPYVSRYTKLSEEPYIPYQEDEYIKWFNEQKAKMNPSTPVQDPRSVLRSSSVIDINNPEGNYTLPEIQSELHLDVNQPTLNLKRTAPKVKKKLLPQWTETQLDNGLVEQTPLRKGINQEVVKKVVVPGKGEIALKTSVDDSGNTVYYFSADLAEGGLWAGKAYKHLEKFIPKGSKILENKSLSTDSFYNVMQRAKNPKQFTWVDEGQFVPLNNAGKNKVFSNSDKIVPGSTNVKFEDYNEAMKALAEFNSRITIEGMPKAKLSKIVDDFQPVKDGPWIKKTTFGIDVPNIGLIKEYKQGGIIKDDRGQWAYPGEITEIGSNQITMQGVPYPVLGISDTGDTKLMKPGKNYKFKGKKVTEFPMAKNGMRQEQKGLVNLDQLTNFTNYNKPQPGGWLNKYN